MNKKILAMAIVPLFMVSIGALAYSASSGSLTTNITANSVPFAATMSANIGAYDALNAIVTGPSGEPYSLSGSTYEVPASPLQLGSADLQTGTLTFTIDLANLSAGDQVGVYFVVNNTGGGQITLGTPQIASSSGFSQGTFTHTVSTSSVTNTSSYAYSQILFTNPAVPGDLHNYDYQVWTSGYNVGQYSVGSTPTLAPTQTAVFGYWFGLASNAASSSIGSAATLSISVEITEGV